MILNIIYFFATALFLITPFSYIICAYISLKIKKEIGILNLLFYHILIFILTTHYIFKDMSKSYETWNGIGKDYCSIYLKRDFEHNLAVYACYYDVYGYYILGLIFLIMGLISLIIYNMNKNK